MVRQRIGQHFLSDPGWREKIARAIRVSPHGFEAPPPSAARDYCWIEVGAGHGEMTEHLVRSDAPVYAVELDSPLVERLKRLAQKHPNLTVVPGDVLQTDLRSVASGRRIRLYGNLPYYITSPILHHLFGYADLIDEVHIVIQLEVAQPSLANDVRQTLAIVKTTTSDYVARINAWFDPTIDRVSERFTKYTHWITIIISAAVVLVVQLDTIAVIDRLSIDDQFRTAFVDSAVKDYSAASTKSATDAQPLPYYDLISKAGLITLPSGNWLREMSDLRKYPGLLLSILLLSLGAPFWYNVLKDLIGLRSSLARKDD